MVSPFFLGCCKVRERKVPGLEAGGQEVLAGGLEAPTANGHFRRGSSRSDQWQRP